MSLRRGQIKVGNRLFNVLPNDFARRIVHSYPVLSVRVAGVRGGQRQPEGDHAVFGLQEDFCRVNNRRWIQPVLPRRAQQLFGGRRVGGHGLFVQGEYFAGICGLRFGGSILRAAARQEYARQNQNHQQTDCQKLFHVFVLPALFACFISSIRHAVSHFFRLIPRDHCRKNEVLRLCR